VVQLTSATDLRRLADAQASLRRIATLVAGGVTAGELFSAARVKCVERSLPYSEWRTQVE
jgi:hypothetical protein